MNQNITLTKAALVKLLDEYPNPDDSGPYGPIGPIIHFIIKELLESKLYPIPIPHVPRPEPDPWRLAGLARMIIDQAVTQYQFASVSAGSELSEKAIAVARVYVHDAIDDWCGTRPRKWPRPPKFDPAQLRPIDLLVAGAQFQKVAALSNPLQAVFSEAADKLFSTGLKRMES